MIVAELFAKFGLLPDEKSWDKGHKLIEGLHTALEAYLGYEGIKKVGELVEGTVKAAVEAKHLGERLGITGEAVQELGYAADVTGSSAEELTTGLQRLALGMENARKTGSGPLVDALHRLRVPIQNLRHEKLDQNLEEIAEGFKKAPPNVDKLALSMEIFGRNAGPKLLPLLEKGQAGIAELRAEAEKLGVVIDEDGIEKAEEFEIAQKKLGATLKGVRNEAVVAILPALQEMAEGLQEWISANRDAIKSGLEAVLKAIAIAFHFVGDAIGVVIDVTKFLGDHLEILIPILTGIAAIVIPLFAEWAIGAGAAAIATLAAAAPLIAIVAIVAAVTAAAIQLYKHWGEIWGFIKRKAQDFADWFEALPGRVLSWVEDIGESIKDAFDDAWDWVVQGAHKAWEKIKNTPIIGHIIRGAQAVGGFVGDLASGPTPGSFGAPGFLGAGAPSLAGAGGDVSNSFEANVQASIQIDATDMDPDDLKDAVKGAMKEHTDDMLRQAHQNLAGGKR